MISNLTLINGRQWETPVVESFCFMLQGTWFGFPWMDGLSLGVVFCEQGGGLTQERGGAGAGGPGEH